MILGAYVQFENNLLEDVVEHVDHSIYSAEQDLTVVRVSLALMYMSNWLILSD